MKTILDDFKINIPTHTRLKLVFKSLDIIPYGGCDRHDHTLGDMSSF